MVAFLSNLVFLVMGALLLLPLLDIADSSQQIEEGTLKVMRELVVKTQPPGIPIEGADIPFEGSSMYEKDTWVETGIAPTKSGAYHFVGWEVDDARYPGNPITLLMDTDHTAIAIYSIGGDRSKQVSDDDEDDKKHLLTIISPYGKTVGSGWYDDGESADFKVLEKYVYDEYRDGVRYAFKAWDDGNAPNLMSNSIVMGESKEVRANWTEEYRLDLLNSLPDVNLIGAGWHEQGSRASLSAISDAELDKVKYTFRGWISAGPNAAIMDDSKLPTTSIIVGGPYTIMADWEKQYYLDINSDYGKVEGEGYYDAGTYGIASIDSEVQQIGRSGVRVVFDGWDGDANSGGMNVKVLMDGPKSIDAKWKKQYYFTINSEYGIPNGSDWYDEGQVANFGINLPRDPAGFWKQQIFYGWDGSFSTAAMTGAVLMNGPKIVTAQWSEDYSIAYLNMGIIGGIIAGASFAYIKFKKRSKSHNDSPVPPNVWMTY
jgi:hypothetical protein